MTGIEYHVEMRSLRRSVDMYCFSKMKVVKSDLQGTFKEREREEIDVDEQQE